MQKIAMFEGFLKKLFALYGRINCSNKLESSVIIHKQYCNNLTKGNSSLPFKNISFFY